MSFSSFSEFVKENQSDINEGASPHAPKSVVDHLIKTAEDLKKGLAGKNGSDDPKHPDASKVSKDLMAAIKALKSVNKGIKDNQEVYLRNTFLK